VYQLCNTLNAMTDDFPRPANPWIATQERQAADLPPLISSPPELIPPIVPPSKWRRRWYWGKRALALSFLLLMGLTTWLAITAPVAQSNLPIAPPRVTLLAADGQPIARNGAIIERRVEAGKLPSHVKQAFLAIEDRRFYSHIGIDPIGLARAFWNNLTGGGTQGGSTITQQLAKVTYLSSDRTYVRKAKEMLIAFWLELWLTKDQILERYLSNVYFGDNVYGLRAASLHYFFRQPERLTLPQAAMLAGLVQAPSRLAPTRNPAAARKRAKMVLNAMAAAKFLTPVQAAATEPARLDVRTKETLPTGTYFADWAMPAARLTAIRGYTEEKIKTTLDARLQKIARGVINRAPLGNAQVALVAMKPNGEVVAMIGGRSYDKSRFNRVTQGQRQPGSTFKLIVYLAALRAGMVPTSIIDDVEITEGPYRPKNSSGRYRGNITLREAFAQSSNVAAVKLYNQLGAKAVTKAARDLGISSPIAADPSVALGSSGTSLVELTAAFAAVAANRYPITPHAIAEEEPGFFGQLWSGQKTFGSQMHGHLLDMLGAVVTQGTGRAARLRIAAYGKTGTSQDNRDALFIGFAGDLVVGVWIGNDDNKPLKNVSGGGLPARIWADFMGQAIKGAALPRPVAPKPGPKAPSLPELPIDLGNSSVELGNDSVTLKTDIGGVDMNFTLDGNGFAVEPSNAKNR
jgi:penicillin-binding protein 1A